MIAEPPTNATTVKFSPELSLTVGYTKVTLPACIVPYASPVSVVPATLRVAHDCSTGASSSVIVTVTLHMLVKDALSLTTYVTVVFWLYGK